MEKPLLCFKSELLGYFCLTYGFSALIISKDGLKDYSEVCLKNKLLICLLALVSVYSFAENLKSSSVTAQALKNMLNNNYASLAVVDKDGDLCIQNEGIYVYITIDENRKLLNFFTTWTVEKQVSENRMARLLNKWNADKIFLIAYNRDKLIYLDYYLCFDGGIDSANFNRTLELIFGIAKSFNDYLLEEDVL